MTKSSVLLLRAVISVLLLRAVVAVAPNEVDADITFTAAIASEVGADVLGAADSKVEDDVAADDASNTVVIPEDEVDANNTAVIPPKVDASVTVVEPTEVGADVPAVMIPSEEEVATEKPKTEKRSGATSGRPQNRGPPRTRAQQRPANKGAAKSPNEASSKKRKNHTAKNSAKSPPKKTSSSDLVPVPSVHNGPRSGAASSTVPNPVHRSQEPLHNSASAFLRHQVLPLLNLPLPTKDVTIHDARELEARFAATAAASAIRPPRGGAVSAPPGLRAAAPTFVPLCEQAGAVVLPKFVPRIPGIHRAEDVELQLQAGAQPGVREQPWVLQVPALVGEGEHQQQLHHGGGLVEHAVGPQTPVHHGPALIVEDPGVQRIARGAVHGEVVNPKVFLPLRAHHFPPACGPKELVHQHQTLSHVPGTVLEACSPAFLEQCCPTYQHQTLEARSPTFLEQCCTTDQYCLQHQQHLQYAGASEEELQHAGEERAEEEKLQYSVSGQNGGSRREPPLCPETLALYEHIHSTWSQTQPAQVGEDYCRQWWQEHQQYQQANQGVEVGGQMPSERNHPTIVGNTIVPPGWATVGNTIVPPGWATQPVSTSGASGSWNGQQQSGGFLGGRSTTPAAIPATVMIHPPVHVQLQDAHRAQFLLRRGSVDELEHGPCPSIESTVLAAARNCNTALPRQELLRRRGVAAPRGQSAASLQLQLNEWSPLRKTTGLQQLQ